MKYTGSAGGIGTLNYKNKPSLGFYVGIWNGYGGQYYVARSYSPESLIEEKTYQERTKNTKKISTGKFMNFVGNQFINIKAKTMGNPLVNTFIGFFDDPDFTQPSFDPQPDNDQNQQVLVNGNRNFYVKVESGM